MEKLVLTNPETAILIEALGDTYRTVQVLAGIILNRAA